MCDVQTTEQDEEGQSQRAVLRRRIFGTPAVPARRDFRFLAILRKSLLALAFSLLALVFPRVWGGAFWGAARDPHINCEPQKVAGQTYPYLRFSLIPISRYNSTVVYPIISPA